MKNIPALDKTRRISQRIRSMPRITPSKILSYSILEYAKEIKLSLNLGPDVCNHLLGPVNEIIKLTQLKSTLSRAEYLVYTIVLSKTIENGCEIRRLKKLKP